MKDYYKFLNVSRTISHDDLKKFYRKGAFEIHPDRNKSINAHNEFVEFESACKFLLDKEIRVKYDKALKEFEMRNNSSFDSSQPEFNKSEVEFEDEDLRRAKNKMRETARKFATMSFDVFEKTLNELDVIGKQVKFGCSVVAGWVLTIFGVLGMISAIYGIFSGETTGLGIIIFISLVSLGLGYGLRGNES
jgi:curved DNA-binding protein CbpA